MERVGDLIDAAIEERVSRRLDKIQSEVQEMRKRLDRNEGIMNRLLHGISRELTNSLDLVSEEVSGAMPILDSTNRQSGGGCDQRDTDRDQKDRVSESNLQVIAPLANDSKEEEIAKPVASFPLPVEFDVFLNFRGEDVRKGFVTHLYKSLKRKEVRTFMDTDGLERGDKISDRLLNAINSSNMAIPIFSKSYADSRWCLMELAEIIKSKRFLLPIFYDVDPSIVRKQKGTFEEAFQRHERVSGPDTANKWREALVQAAERAGFDLQGDANGFEANLIQMVVEKVEKELDRIILPRMLPTPQLSGATAVAYQKQIMELLADPNVHSIGVWGMGGVGKTCIIRNIYNGLQKEGSTSFDYIIYVEVPYEVDLRLVRNEIKKQARLRNLPDEGNELRASAMLKERLQGCRFLLILDDLWKSIDLYQELGIPKPHAQNKGCKILLTTRNYDVCTSMCIEENVKVKPMPYKEAWDFFCEKVGGNIPQGVRDSTARQIVELCGGLPVGLLVVAEYLKNQKGAHSWSVACDELLSSRPLNQKMKEQVFDRLRLSFERLESEKLQECFLACAFSIWRSDHTADHLAIEFIAEGLVRLREDAGLTTAFHACYNEIEKLRKACLLEDGASDPTCIRMEALIRSMALHLKGDAYAWNHTNLRFAPGLEVWARAEKISLKGTSIETLPDNPYCPQLISLSIHCNHLIQQIHDEFFEQMERLRVLVLRCTQISRIPTSVSKVVDLRYLNLGNNKNLKSIEGVGTLKHLLFLIINGSSIESFPSEMSQLSKLVFLDADNTKYLRRIPSEAISKLCSIESLYMSGSAYSWSIHCEGEMPEMVCLKDLRSLPRLRNLRLTVARDEDFEYVRRATVEAWSCFGILSCYIEERKEGREYDFVSETWVAMENQFPSSDQMLR